MTTARTAKGTGAPRRRSTSPSGLAEDHEAHGDDLYVPLGALRGRWRLAGIGALVLTVPQVLRAPAPPGTWRIPAVGIVVAEAGRTGPATVLAPLGAPTCPEGWCW